MNTFRKASFALFFITALSSLTACADDDAEEAVDQAVAGLKSCGSSEACGDDKQFCRFKDGSCGEDRAVGNCAVKPESCIELWDPVCGCDGKTYGNSCGANMAGVSVRAKGECPPE